MSMLRLASLLLVGTLFTGCVDGGEVISFQNHTDEPITLDMAIMRGGETLWTARESLGPKEARTMPWPSDIRGDVMFTASSGGRESTVEVNPQRFLSLAVEVLADRIDIERVQA